MNPEQLLAHFSRISDAPNAIPRLRSFILDLAVRGRLIEQHPNDEPATALLRHIQAKKAQQVKGNRVKMPQPFRPMGKAEMPFPIPKTWLWVPATFPAYLISDMGKKVQTKDVLQTGKFPVVDQGKVFIRGFCNDKSKVIHIKEPIILFGDHTRETKLIDFDFVVGAEGVKLLHPVCVVTDYYFLVLRWLPLASRGYGRHFKLLRAAHIPLPPHAEQRRIVTKVNELMTLCDRLESAQQEREAWRDQLELASLHRLNQPSNGDTTAFHEYVGFHLKHLACTTTRPEQIKRLRTTFLNLAVRGKLTCQSQDEETAHDLLNKIRAEKARLPWSLRPTTGAGCERLLLEGPDHRHRPQREGHRYPPHLSAQVV